MKAKSKADRLSVRLVHMEILLALALLGVVFLTAAHSDTVSARQQMATPFDTSRNNATATTALSWPARPRA